MVVLVIHQNSIISLEVEGKTPVSADRHGPVVLNRLAFLIFSGQFVQLPSRSIHVIGFGRSLQGGKLGIKAGSMRGLASGLRSSLKISLDAFVSDAFDHTYIVHCHYTVGTEKNRSCLTVDIVLQRDQNGLPQRVNSR